MDIQTKIEAFKERIEALRGGDASLVEDTLQVMAPEAEKYGLHALQVEMQNLAVEVGYPDDYRQIKSLLQESEAMCEIVFKTFTLPIRAMLDAIGLEYGFRNIFMIRAGYGLENIGRGAKSNENETAAILLNSDSFFTGPAVGASVCIPFTKERQKHAVGPRLYIDYGYRFTNRWRGNHYMGIKVAL